MLAKGPVAPFLAAVIVLIFAVAKGDYRLITRTLWIPGMALFCLVMLPWYVAVQLKNPEFFRVFILEHNLARFGNDVFHHTEPFWYFIPVALLALVPWTMFVTVAVFEIVRKWTREKRELFHSPDALTRVSPDLVDRADCVFFIFSVEASGIYLAGVACGHPVVGGVCAGPRD